MTLSENKVSYLTKFGNKFIRRTDLDPSTRLYIASAALIAILNRHRGKISEIAKCFEISRTFVYMLLTTLVESDRILFGKNSLNSEIPDSQKAVLSLRLEGRCSIDGISAIMKRFGMEHSSAGSISQFLTNMGSLLPNTLSADDNEIKIVVFVSDEIFSKKQPILITVDPISSAILRIELAETRKAEDWKNHWECLEENGYFAAYVVSDEGKGLTTAQKQSSKEIFRQPDTYHAVAHALGQWVGILENSAMKAIEAEYDAYKIFDSAKTDKVINKRIDKYAKTKRIADEKIELYDNFRFLYKCIIEALRIFDNNGKLKERKESEENIKSALDLIELLGHEKINTAVKKIRRVSGYLLNYFDIAKSVVAEIKELPIVQEASESLFSAWQWEKSAIKIKDAKKRTYFVSQYLLWLEIAKEYLQENFDRFKEFVYNRSDQIVQSSSLAECINSIISPYLNNSKNNISQETLNLIMFYHNHRRYNDGKRKGKTPMEILTGKNQTKDWIEILFDIVNKKDPTFLPI
jgi:hypothetical protein